MSDGGVGLEKVGVHLRHCSHGSGETRRPVTAAEPRPKSKVTPLSVIAMPNLRPMVVQDGGVAAATSEAQNMEGYDGNVCSAGRLARGDRDLRGASGWDAGLLRRRCRPARMRLPTG